MSPFRSSTPLRTLDALEENQLVNPSARQQLEKVAERFAVSITQEMVDAIDVRDALDPIAAQFVPSVQELEISPIEKIDPIGDDVHTPVKGITHRYPDRVLLKPVHVCPVYCRFCFRREKVGPGKEVLSKTELDAAFEYIRSHSEIWEVILSGGDPFILPADRIAHLVSTLTSIPHVKIIRVHTRVPVVDSRRIHPELVQALKSKKATYVVLHINHVRELTVAAKAACAQLVDAGIPMLSQTVLLKGINDTPQALEDLFRALVENRIKPYYLHHGDLAEGTSHFRTTVAHGQELMATLRGSVSGLCQPQYVLDIPGGYGKVPIGPHFLESKGPNHGYEVRDIQGRIHRYEDSVVEVPNASVKNG